MIRMHRRRFRSQRPMSTIGLTLEPNWGGQDGVPYLTLKGDDNIYYQLVFETEEDIREMLSQVHIAFHNYKSEEELKTVKRKAGVL